MTLCPFPTRGIRFRALALAACCLLSAGCHSMPFGPNFAYEPLPFREPPRSVELEVVDERPKWQKQYWQGAESPRDFEQAVTFIPLEQVRPLPEEGATPTLGERLKLDDAREANCRQITTALGVELDQASFIPQKSVLHLKSFVVVVNKQEVFREIWESTADARREALIAWRRNSTVRTMVGLASGITPGLNSSQFGAGVMLGGPSDMPTLPGEKPLARTWGAVTGPPPELGDYGPDVTCVIEAELEFHIDRDAPHRLELSSIARSLPLEPPHFLTDAAVPATVRQALLQLVENARQEFALIDGK